MHDFFRGDAAIVPFSIVMDPSQSDFAGETLDQAWGMGDYPERSDEAATTTRSIGAGLACFLQDIGMCSRSTVRVSFCCNFRIENLLWAAGTNIKTD